MESAIDIESSLVKLDKQLHEILHSLKDYKVKDKDTEIKSLRGLINRISSHRVLEKDTTVMVREMRDRTYDI